MVRCTWLCPLNQTCYEVVVPILAKNKISEWLFCFSPNFLVVLCVFKQGSNLRWWFFKEAFDIYKKDFLEPRIISSRGHPSDFYTKTPVIVAFPKILLFKIKNQPRCVGRLIYVHPKSPKRKKNCKPSVKCIVFKILWICIAINYESSSYVSETE